jgi:hypothetical protein
MKIAVFTTSELQGYSKDKANEVLHVDSDGHSIRKGTEVERAFDLGYKVFVVTTRRQDQLGTHDQWWRDLVGLGQTFCATERVDEDDLGGANSPSTCAGWRKLYAKLGLEWPSSEYEVRGKPFVLEGSWVDARHALTKHGIKLGNDPEFKLD